MSVFIGEYREIRRDRNNPKRVHGVSAVLLILILLLSGCAQIGPLPYMEEQVVSIAETADEVYVLQKNGDLSILDESNELQKVDHLPADAVFHQDGMLYYATGNNIYAYGPDTKKASACWKDDEPFSIQLAYVDANCFLIYRELSESYRLVDRETGVMTKIIENSEQNRYGFQTGNEQFLVFSSNDTLTIYDRDADSFRYHDCEEQNRGVCISVDSVLYMMPQSQEQDPVTVLYLDLKETRPEVQQDTDAVLSRFWEILSKDCNCYRAIYGSWPPSIPDVLNNQ